MGGQEQAGRIAQPKYSATKNCRPSRSTGCLRGGIRSCQNCRYAPALFKQINFRARRQINPTAERITAEPCHGDHLTATAAHKKRPSCCIKFDTRETKVERFIPAWFVVASVRQMAERDPCRQLAAGALKIELIPNHFAISERLRMIRADNTRRTCKRRNACSKEGRQKKCDSHPANLPSTRAIVQHGRVSPTATSVLEWIVNWQRLVPHKTICAIGATVTAAKHRLHILRSRTAAS